ncbi:MAG: VIT domain-containing protein [Pirellulales bacterium]
MNEFHNDASGDACDSAVGDENVERLLRTAYHPEPVAATFAERVRAAMQAAAAEQPTTRQNDDDSLAPATEPPPPVWKLAIAAAVAASVIFALFSISGPGQHRDGFKGSENGPDVVVVVPQGPVQFGEGRNGRRDWPKDLHTNFRPLAAALVNGRVTATEAAAVDAPPLLAVGESLETGDRQRKRVRLGDGSVVWLNENGKIQLVGERRLRLDRGEAFFEVAPRGGDGAKNKQNARFVVDTPDREVEALGTKFVVRVAPQSTDVVVAQGKVAVTGIEKTLTVGEQVSAPRDAKLGLLVAEATQAPRVSAVLDWARDLYAAASPPLVPVSDHTGGALVVKAADGQETRLSMRKYHLDVHIEDGFARTTIDQTYFNDLPSRQEGTFFFPLPADASISRLAMYVGGKLMEGGMAERQHAAEVFESIKRKMQDPALLEWIDGTTFRMRVFPLEGREEKRIVLSYTQRLPALYGKTTYRFPAGHNLGKVALWSATVHVDHAANVDWRSPSHTFAATKKDSGLTLTTAAKDASLDRDVVVELTSATVTSATVAAAADAGAKESGKHTEKAAVDRAPRFARAEHEKLQYYVLRQRPELPRTSRRERRDWILLVETSADRDPLLARAQIEVARGVLEHVEHDDTFTILTAAAGAKQLTDGMTAATAEPIRDAIGRLEDTQLLGALDLSAALSTVKPIAAACGNPYLVHLGGGQPVLGEREQAALVAELPARTKYIGVGVGKRWNRSLMKLAASKSGGYFTQINPDENIAWRALDLVATLNAPRLLDVRVTDDAGRTWLTFDDAVADGEEVCAVVRLDAVDGKPLAEPVPPAPKSVTISGTLDGQPYQQSYQIENVADNAGYLPRMWAKLEIDRLVAEYAAAYKDRIVELSKAMYVMSPFTSLLVLENEAMYAQYNVDRGRKDHWAMYPCPAEMEVVRDSEPSIAQTEPQSVRPSTEPTTELEAKVAEVNAKSLAVYQSVYIQPRFLRGYWVDTQYFGRRSSVERYRIADGRLRENALYYTPEMLARTQGLGVYGLSTNGTAWHDGETGFSTARIGLGWPVNYYDVTADIDVEFEGYEQLSDFTTVNGASAWSQPQFADNFGLYWTRHDNLREFWQYRAQSQPPVDRYYRAFDGRGTYFAGVDINGLRGSTVFQSGGGGPVTWAMPMLVRPGEFAVVGSRRVQIMGNERFIKLTPNVAWTDFDANGVVDFFGSSRFDDLLDRLPPVAIVVNGNSLAERGYLLGFEGLALRNTPPYELDLMRRGSRGALPNERYSLFALSDLTSQRGLVRFGDDVQLWDADHDSDGLADNRWVDVNWGSPQLAKELKKRRLEQTATQLRELLKTERSGLEELNLAAPVDRLGLGAIHSPVQLEYFDETDSMVVTGSPQDTETVLELVRNLQESRQPEVEVLSREKKFAGRGGERSSGDGERLGEVEPFAGPNLPGEKLNLVRQPPTFPSPSTFVNSASSLIGYAAGMQTTAADVQAVLEEDVPERRPTLGKIDGAARKLIDRSRSRGWQQVTIPLAAPYEPLVVNVDGAGRHRYTRYTEFGLGERVVCDGKHEWRLYDELGVGAKRVVSRYHRAGIEQLVPWLMPPAEDLAVAGDVQRVDEKTVAIVREVEWEAVKVSLDNVAKLAEPVAADDVVGEVAGKTVTESKAVELATDEARQIDVEKLLAEAEREKRVTRYELRLVFADDGRLVERQWLVDGKLLLKVSYAADGRIVWLDAKGKLLAERKLDVRAAKAPSVVPDTRRLVVLPLPWRRWGTGPTAELKTAKALDYPNYTDDEAMAALAALLVENDASAVQNLIAQRYFGSPQQVRGKRTAADRRLGFYMILCLAGCNWQPDSLASLGGVVEQKIPATPLADHPDSPMAWLLARDLADRGIGHGVPPAMPEVASDKVGKSLAATLIALRRLYPTDFEAVANLEPAFRATAEKAANENLLKYWQVADAFVQNTRSPMLAMAVLQTMQEASAKSGSDWTRVALGYERWKDSPAWSDFARYEAARAWFRSGDRRRAQDEFGSWYAAEVDAGRLPLVDDDFRMAYYGPSDEPPNGGGDPLANHFSRKLLDAAKTFSARGQQATAILVAWQAYQFKLSALGDAILNRTLASLPSGEVIAGKSTDRFAKEVASARLAAARFAAIAVLYHTEQWDRADSMLTPLLDDERFAGATSLWRLAADLAERRGRIASSVARWERVAELEYERLGEKHGEEYEVAAARQPYVVLMQQYEKLVTATATSESLAYDFLDRGSLLEESLAGERPRPAGLAARVVQAADRWRTLDTDATDACLAAAKVLSTLGEQELAWQYATTPLAQQNAVAAPYETIAQQLAARGVVDLALRAYDAAEAADRDNAKLLWDRAKLLETHGRFAEARATYRRLADGQWPAEQADLKRQAAEQVVALDQVEESSLSMQIRL